MASKEIRAKRLSAGKCMWCGRNADISPEKRCTVCKQKNKNHKKTQRKNRSDNGLCITCGRYKEDPKLSECANCQIARVERKRMSASWV